MTVASIDIGSNTVLLLVARLDEKTRKITYSKTFYRVPRISQGVKEDLSISVKQETLLLEVLTEFQAIIKKFNCEVVLPVATSAFRNAANAEYIVHKIKYLFGWETKILSGDEEASLTFFGATFPFQNNEGKTVIDIGGGSTEVVFGNSNHITYKKSFAIGVVSLFEKLLKGNPPLLKQLNKAINEVNKILEPLNNIFSPFEAIAVAGTPTTLLCMKNKIRVFDDSLVDNKTLSRVEIESFRTELSALTYNQIKEKYGNVVEGREDVLLAGTIILERTMHILQLNKVTVSTKGLRFGVVYDYLTKTNNFSGM